MIIKSHSDFNVIGKVSNSDELFNLLKTKKPNVLLINLALLQENVLVVIKKLAKNYPEIPVVFLTGGVSKFVILECINNGVQGMLWKESTPEHLIEAISTVVAGERYLDIPESQIAAKIIQHIYTRHANSHNITLLTERENEVLILFAEGLIYKEIADRLNISTRTVESHKNNILTKLELNSVTDMVKYAIKHNLIEI